MNFLDECKKMHVALVAGGSSPEAEISLQGARAVCTALSANAARATLINLPSLDRLSKELRANSYDVVFVMMHGCLGEDGSLQALLDDLNIPYTGSGQEASCLAWDKLMSKECWRTCGLATPVSVAVHTEADCEKAFAELKGQLMIKPIRGGSSMGLTRIDTQEGLQSAYALAESYQEGIMAEALVTGFEYTVPILNGHALPSVRIHTENNLYDYVSKYESDATRYLCPAGLSSKEETQLRQLALDAFDALGCSGWGRVDIMRDENHVFQLLEANTVPGMTERSLVPKSARVVGIDFESLVLAILESAYIVSEKKDVGVF